MKPTRQLRNLLLGSTLLATITTAHATDYTWDAGGGGSRIWTNAANWVGDNVTAPTFNDQANIIFNTGTMSLSSGFGSAIRNNQTIGSLTFNSTATKAFTLALASGANDDPGTGKVLTLGSADVAPSISVDADSANHTIGGATQGSITLANNLTTTINGSVTLTIARPINETGGSFGITKSGSGFLNLSAANTFTGSTSIASGGGNMNLTNVNALQYSAIDTTNTVTGTTTAGFRVNYGANTGLNIGGLIGNKNLATIFDTDNGNYGSVTAITLNTVAGKDLSYSGVIDGSRSLTKSGDGTQTLSGDNSYTGGTTTSAGTLTLSHTNAAGTGAISLTGATSVLKISSGISLGNTANDITISNAGASVVRTVAASAAYSLGTGIDLKSDLTGGTDTTAQILGGTNGGAEENLTLGFSGTSAAGNDGIRRSDVFTIANSGSFDEFVLQLVVSGSASDTKLGWLNGSNQWVNAGSTFYSETYDFAARSLGDYGFDITTGSAWAVLNPASASGSYALIPEPTSALAGLLLTAGLLRRRRRNAGC